MQSPYLFCSMQMEFFAHIDYLLYVWDLASHFFLHAPCVCDVREFNFVCVSVCIHIWVSTCGSPPRLMSGIILKLSSTVFNEQGLSIQPSTHIWLASPASLLWGSSLFNTVIPPQQHSHWSGCLNFGLHTCSVSTLPDEPSSQSLGIFKMSSNRRTP